MINGKRMWAIKLNEENTYKVVKCARCNGTGVLDEYIKCNKCGGVGRKIVDWVDYLTLSCDHTGAKVL